MKRLLFFLLCTWPGLAAAADDAPATGSAWQIATQTYAAPYHGVTLANGGIGILPWREPLSIRRVMLNHVFDADAPHGISRVLPGLNPFSLSVSINGREIGRASCRERV